MSSIPLLCDKKTGLPVQKKVCRDMICDEMYELPYNKTHVYPDSVLRSCPFDELELQDFNQLRVNPPNGPYMKPEEYVKQLEEEYSEMQHSYLKLMSQNARMQFHMQQVLEARPCKRLALLRDLERFVCNPKTAWKDVMYTCCEDRAMGKIFSKQKLLVNKLREQLSSLEDAEAMEPLPYNLKDFSAYTKLNKKPRRNKRNSRNTNGNGQKGNVVIAEETAPPRNSEQLNSKASGDASSKKTKKNRKSK